MFSNKMANLTSKQSMLFVLCLFQIIGIFLYLPGFLPLPSISNRSIITPTVVESTSNKASIYSGREDDAKFDRLILMVVDALREDFVFTKDSTLPFLQSLIGKNESISYTSISKPPTVTLPRIKALVSGSVASFIDVALNFASSEMTDDNLIAQLKAKGKKVVFYGDDTWVKLFPNSFNRYDGTTSFFVTDYVEVDNNVTRHLPDELKAKDWDCMILHYLGLDHIGHLAGPKSPLVPHKLKEMDNIIKLIYQSITNIEDTEGLKTLLLVTGDHGMADGGSHGGASDAEVRSPAVFISPQFKANGKGQAFDGKVINQVDIAPTLSILLGLNVPRKSVGAIIPQFWIDSPSSVKLKIINQNACQLLSIAQMWTEKMDLLKRLEEICFLSSFNKSKSIDTESTSEFISITKELQSIVKQLQEHSSSHNYVLMLSGILLLVCCCILTGWNLYGYLHHNSHTRNNESCTIILYMYIVCGSFIQPFSLFSTSLIEEEHLTWYFMVLTLLLLVTFVSVTLQLDVAVTNTNSHSSLPFKRRYMTYLFQFVVMFVTYRLIVTWNQSGVKYIGNEDMGDVLREPDHINILSIVTLLSIFTQIYIMYHDSRDGFTSMAFSFGLLAVYWYQSAVNNLLSVSFMESTDRGLTQSRLVFCIIILMFFKAVKNGLQTDMDGFVEIFTKSGTLLIFLLARVHNITWLALVSVFLFIFRKVMAPRLLSITGNYVPIYLSYFWLGKVLFYAQGNSISFATIDVNAAFVGMTDVNMVIAALLIILSTYTGQILAFFGLLRFLSDQKRSIYDPTLHWIWLTLSCLELTLFTIQCFLQRFHLFIWSVFAPKLIYVLVSSALTSIFITVLIMIQMLLNKLRHRKTL